MSFSETTYDCVVVGAGIVGSFTAFHMVNAGYKTLLLDQFPLPHSNGSSAGTVRGMELSRPFPGPEIMREICEVSRIKWQELQNTTIEELIKNNSLLHIGPKTSDMIQRLQADIQDKCPPYLELLDNAACASRFPELKLPADYVGILDTSALLLFAERILHTLREHVLKKDGVIMDGTKMTDVSPGDTVLVHTDKGTIRCKSLVLTVGPWASNLPPVLGLDNCFKVEMVTVADWCPKPTKSEVKLPSVVEIVNGRICWFNAERNTYRIVYGSDKHIQIDEKSTQDDSDTKDELKKHVTQRYPFLEDLPECTSKCWYTFTPDSSFILDRHPKWRNIILGLGMSGAGFGVSPVIGKILADLANDDMPQFDLTPFRYQRLLGKS